MLARASMIARNSCGPPRPAGPVRDRRGQNPSPAQTGAMPITINEMPRAVVRANTTMTGVREDAYAAEPKRRTKAAILI
jgi:hypothetical protein